MFVARGAGKCGLVPGSNVPAKSGGLLKQRLRGTMDTEKSLRVIPLLPGGTKRQDCRGNRDWGGQKVETAYMPVVFL